MSDTKSLKMKIKLHQFEVELEGTPEDVKEQYQDIKAFIMNDLLPKVNFADKPEPPPPIRHGALKQLPPAQEVEHIEVPATPSLKEIKLRDLAKTEADWLVVYCCYASEQGTKEFSREDITQLYKDSDRHTRDRIKNLSQYIKSAAKSGFIKPTNNTHFILLDKGRQKVAEIFAGHSKASSVKGRATSKSSTPKASEASQGTSKVVTKVASKGPSRKFDFDLDRNLDLHPGGKPSLKEFSAGYVIDSTPKRIAVILHYLLSILKVPVVSGNHIYTGLEELGGKIPPSLKQIFINTKGRKIGWIDFNDLNDISLTIHGKNALKLELLKK